MIENDLLGGSYSSEMLPYWFMEVHKECYEHYEILPAALELSLQEKVLKK